jgi:hypothetical protein
MNERNATEEARRIMFATSTFEVAAMLMAHEVVRDWLRLDPTMTGADVLDRLDREGRQRVGRLPGELGHLDALRDGSYDR